MELPISTIFSHKITHHVQSFAGAIAAPFLREESHPTFDHLIMPLYEVEKKLHQHYVDTKPVWVTYEFYNRDQRISQETVFVTVQSTVRNDRRIVLTELNQKRSFILDLEQILTVSANIA